MKTQLQDRLDTAVLDLAGAKTLVNQLRALVKAEREANALARRDMRDWAASVRKSKTATKMQERIARLEAKLEATKAKALSPQSIKKANRKPGKVVNVVSNGVVEGA